jgi:hypothetical protein
MAAHIYRGERLGIIFTCREYSSFVLPNINSGFSHFYCVKHLQSVLIPEIRDTY